MPHTARIPARVGMTQMGSQSTPAHFVSVLALALALALAFSLLSLLSSHNRQGIYSIRNLALVEVAEKQLRGNSSSRFTHEPSEA